MPRFIVESDYLVLVKQIQNERKLLSPLGHIIGGLQNVFKTFPPISIHYASRNLNVPAHLLAKYAYELDECLVWMEEAPECVMLVIIYLLLNTSSFSFPKK